MLCYAPLHKNAYMSYGLKPPSLLISSLNTQNHRSLPLSKSSSASMSLLITGPAALGSSFVRRAACSWTSSSSSSRNRPWVTGGAGAEVEGEPEEELPPLLWARERTMSFLQMGQVRRRVVSQGVLGGC